MKWCIFFLFIIMFACACDDEHDDAPSEIVCGGQGQHDDEAE